VFVAFYVCISSKKKGSGRLLYNDRGKTNLPEKSVKWGIFSRVRRNEDSVYTYIYMEERKVDINCSVCFVMFKYVWVHV